MRYSFFVLILFILSCKKDTTQPPVPAAPPPVEDTLPPCDPQITANHSYDTIYPSDYLMAYPGSWWEYDDGFIDSCTSWQEVLIHYTTSVGSCKFVEEDLWILPEKLLYCGGNIAYNLNVRTPDDFGSTSFGKIYDTVPGVYSTSSSSGGEGTYSYTSTSTTEMMPQLDSLLVNGTTYYDVIHKKISVYVYYYHAGGGPTYYTDYYFAKDVGLIMHSFSSNTGILNEYKLVNYYIAPH